MSAPIAAMPLGLTYRMADRKGAEQKKGRNESVLLLQACRRGSAEKRELKERRSLPPKTEIIHRSAGRRKEKEF